MENNHYQTTLTLTDGTLCAVVGKLDVIRKVISKLDDMRADESPIEIVPVYISSKLGDKDEV